ncbi:M55 family metallopeptidase [Clostridium sp. DL1XJH146]
MKIFISADIEGVTGVTHWDETEKPNGDYPPFAEQMTREVLAACRGAQLSGAEQIVIKDAHSSGRNLIHSLLPEESLLIKGWSGHPFSMVQELDSSFDAAMFIGYHSGSGSSGSPLCHTMHEHNISYIKINGEETDEFLLHAYAAAYVGVPVVLVTGDKELKNHVKKINPNIKTVAVKEGIGNSTISLHPDIAISRIKKAAQNSLDKELLQSCLLKIPDEFDVIIGYSKPHLAYKASFYPGAQKVSPTAIRFVTNDYFEVMRMMMFLT